jgi:hypothetical protein
VTSRPASQTVTDETAASTPVAESSQQARRLPLLICSLVLLGFVARLFYGYDADELQHLHFAWNIAQGHVPFRDFFEHHPPLLHYLMAPFVGGLTEPGFTLLLMTRLIALGVVAVLLRAFYLLLQKAVPARTAWWGLLALVTLHPFGTQIFEFRADWIALASALAAANLLLPTVRPEGSHPIRSAFVAGLATGIGVGLTQKTLFLLAGMLAWCALAAAYAEDPPTRRRRIAVMAVFTAGAVLPVVLLLAFFAAQGAGAAFVDDVLRINMRWASEGTWRYVVQESFLPSLPVYVLAFARLAAAASQLRSHLRRSSPEALVAILLALGTLAMLQTPVPHGQSFLFFVGPWAAYLAVCAVEGYANDPTHLRRDVLFFVGAAIFCLAGLYPVNAAIAVAMWGLLVTLVVRRVRQEKSSTGRRDLALALGLTVGVLVYAGRVVDGVRRHEARDQARFIAFAHAQIPAGEAVLETWPLVTPFRPQPSEHGFARVGIVQTLSPAVLEDEYIGAVRSGKARAVIVDEQDIARQLPRFAQFLHTECYRAVNAPPTRDRLQLYLYTSPATRP